MRFTAARRNAMLDTNITPLNSGRLRIYSGTRPVDGDTALSGNTLLAELVLNATFSPSAASATLTANAITADASADATGTASFVRAFQSDGTTVVGDLSVSITGGGGEVQFSTLSFVETVAISLSSFTINQPIGA